MNQITGRRYRVASWYGKDEAYMMYWEGWRQYNNLFDSLTISEVRLGKVKHMLYKTGTRRLWQGRTADYAPQTAAPYLVNGSNTVGGPNAQFDFLGFSNGLRHSMGMQGRLDVHTNQPTVPVDYDTYWGAKPVGASQFTVDLPIPESLYVGTVVANTYEQAVRWGSPQCLIEGTNYLYLLDPDFLFLGAQTPWYANVWAYGEWIKTNDDPNIYAIASRPLTGSEFNAIGYGALALGAKGLITYYGVSSDGSLNTSTPACTGATPGSLTSLGITSLTTDDSYITTTGLDLVRDARLGGDFFLESASEPTHFTEFMVHNGTVDRGYFASKLGVDSTRLYAGRESCRRALHRLYRYAYDHRATLEALELQCWWAKGYKQWTLEKTAGTLTNYLRLDSTLAVAHPSRVDTMGRMNREDYDSVFVDITLHKHRDTAMSTMFVVGLVNRRTDPRLHYLEDTVFLTEAEFEGRLESNLAEAYDQRGAREIRLPFHYVSPDGLAYNLHVQQLTHEGETGIDTVIGANGLLAVRLRPGYGTFLRVKPVRASATDGQLGYLDHSNQRKLVAFPEVTGAVEVFDTVDMRTYLRMVVGDTMWYHQVYHRRRPTQQDPEGGFLTVYYRRSKPLLTTDNADTTGSSAYVFDASTIEWEDPVVVSDQVLYQPPGAEEPDVMDLSCGYPALVVRPVITDTDTVVSQVYIVFGCEYLTEQNASVLVCETILPVEASRAEQQAYYAANPSEVLDVTPAPTVPILEHWGTPMVNASHSGNFYCWSHATNGIGVGFKDPVARQFLPAQRLYLHGQVITPDWRSTHPSLNSYSRLQLGEEDAALVWQEGENATDGSWIYYTRLFHGPAPGYAIAYDLNPGYTRITAGPPFADPNNGQIGIVTDPYVTVDSAQFDAGHNFPVVYRHLSDWETTPENTRHDIRLVNYKADRVYWQSRKVHLGLGPWMIGRRNIDVADSSLSPVGGTDWVYTQGEEFIFSETLNLRGPDATQGEQWGEPGSIPNNDDVIHYDDSCSALSFWSDTADADPFPHIWHMLYGWEFYGQTADHLTDDLIATGQLQQIHGYGWYPHLAARYSVSAHRGIQRNRRIYNEPGGVWLNYQHAPVMTTSSEYFYKPTQTQTQPKGIPYHGFRGPTAAALVGLLRFPGLDKTVMLHADTTSFDRAEKPHAPRRFLSPWFTVPQATDLQFTTTTSGKEAAATLSLERYSDGETVMVDALARRGTTTKAHQAYTVVGDQQERYRFVLEPLGDAVYAAKDIEIIMPDDEGLRKPVSQIQYGGLIDLRTMHTSTMPRGSVQLYPNPASDYLGVAYDATVSTVTGYGTSDVAPASTTIQVTDERGRELYHCTAPAAGMLTVPTHDFASGVYHVVITTDHGMAPLTATFIVVH